MNMRDMPLYVSPLMALVTFAQFVGEFRSFGNIWPPLVQGFLDFLEIVFTLNLDSLNMECAFGKLYFPSNYWGRQFTRLATPLILIHMYVLIKTMRILVVRVAILFSKTDESLPAPRPSAGENGLAENTGKRVHDLVEFAKGMKFFATNQFHR